MKFLNLLRKDKLALSIWTTCLLFVTSISVAGATFQVTNTADSGAGSLRQAVADANLTADADTINFNIPLTDPNCDANGVCTITLTSGVIMNQAEGGALSIVNQSGADKLLISGNNASRVFENGLGANLTLDGISVINGVNSEFLGVVTNFRGDLTIKNSVFRDNSSVYIIHTNAFESDGSLNISKTSVRDNVGTGVYLSNEVTTGGILNIVDSTISNNQGRGIYFYGDQFTITNSTVSGNSSTQGGGMYLAGITSIPGSRRLLTNTTVTNNSASESGGGIFVFQSSFNLRNSIIAGNTSDGGAPDIRFLFAGAVSFGHNLIGNATDTGTQTGQWNADILNQNAQLAPLADNGGTTQTHALLPNSPAINAGINCVLTANGCGDNNPAVPTDQRGRPRVGNVDIGAFEVSGQRAKFDFDGDSKTDYGIYRPSGGIWYLLNSTNGFSALQFGVSTDNVTPTDFDGDGRADVAVFRNGTWYLLQSTAGFEQIQFGLQGDVPVPADFDGDGKADMAVYRNGANGGQSYFYYLGTLDNPNNNITFIPLGISNDKPIVGDFDGDGKADPAVYRNGVWYMLQSSEGFAAIQFGIATDRVTPGDFDGDGKTDLAVYRNGTWYVLNSSDLQVDIFQFGLAADAPTVGDYDGDGKADISVWRESNGVFYVVGSQAGFTANVFGTNGDTPVASAYNQ